MPAGIADCAASTYFCTLTVENCGASGMPTTRVTPDPARAPSTSAMNGCQLRMPTITFTSGPRRSRSAFRCRKVMSVSGERPPIAP